MVLDLHDGNVRAQLTLKGAGRARITIDYPAQPEYAQAVWRAFTEFLRPPDDRPSKRNRSPRSRATE